MKRLILLLPVLAALAAAGCGGEEAVSVGPVPTGTGPASGSSPGGDTTTSTTGTTSETTTSPDATTPATVSYHVMFVGGDHLMAMPRSHPATPRVGSAALTDLVAGPTKGERANGVTTAIPAGTRFLGLVIEHGLATVDLSSEYESEGGTLSFDARVAQVACTLDQFPTVDSVAFELDGRATPVAAEGATRDSVRCKEYSGLLPAILVEHPAPGSQVQSGVRVYGTANVFEANVSYELVADEHVYAKGFTTATCGTGCRGQFLFRLRFHVDEPTEATLLVHDDDAAGTGSPPHVVRIPLTLVPG